jgi:predicted Zn-dependent protease
VRQNIHTNAGIPEPKTMGYVISVYAASLNDLNRKEEAVRVERDALIVNPYDPRVNFAYGVMVVKTDRQDAIRHWETALSGNRIFPACAAALAHERVKDGRFADAVKLLEPVMVTIGWNSQSWMDLADAKIGLHDYAGASKALDDSEKAILVIRPDIDKRRNLIRDLQSKETKQS